jgi:hypothetical protein
MHSTFTSATGARVLRRNEKDFDEWFKAAGGDPWGYHKRAVRNRLHASLAFLQQCGISPDFAGTFVEPGAFDGSFTELLAARYPASRILASDISGVAVDKAAEKLRGRQNVALAKCDLLNLRNPGPAGGAPEPTIVLLLECLYYLPEQERAPALANVAAQFPGAGLFVSAPIIGNQYFTEQGLLALCEASGYRPRASKVLNLRSRVFNHIPGMRTLCQVSPLARTRLANQVIYALAAQHGTKS